MKTSDLALLAGAGIAGYFLFVKPMQDAAKNTNDAVSTVASGVTWASDTAQNVATGVYENPYSAWNMVSSLLNVLQGNTTGVKDTLATTTQVSGVTNTLTGVKQTLASSTTPSTNTGLNVADPAAVAALGNSARFATSVTPSSSKDPLISIVTTTGGGAYASWRAPANTAERTAARNATLASFAKATGTKAKVVG